jgi:hypothetical protein
VHLLGRFFSGRMMVRHAGVPGNYPGTPWLCLIGIPEQAARLYAEPLLALAVALWAAALGMVLPRFQPALLPERCAASALRHRDALSHLV